MGRLPAPPAPRRPVPSSQGHHPSSHAAPAWGLEISMAHAHCPESPMPASHPSSSWPPHLCPQAEPTWLPVDSTLGWLLFSPEYGRLCVCVCVCGQMDRGEAVLGGAPITPLLVAQSAPLHAPLTPAIHLGKGTAASGKAGKGGKEEAPS